MFVAPISRIQSSQPAKKSEGEDAPDYPTKTSVSTDKKGNRTPRWSYEETSFFISIMKEFWQLLAKTKDLREKGRLW
jgi:hypothetical protein